MSNTDLLNVPELSEDVPTDNEEEQELDVDHLNEEPKREEKYQFDVIVIGSGPGGYTSAIRCAQLGKSVAVVEQDLLGGHAVNWGCIPLNAMIASARLIRSLRESVRYGIDISSHRIEYVRIARHRDQAVKKVRSQIRHFLDKYHIQLYIGTANILDGNHILIQPIRKYTYTNVFDADGHSPYEVEEYAPITSDITISSENIIIASGVKYELPDFVEANDRRTVDPTQLLWHRTIPESLIIIGGGILGCEFACLYSHLRSNVILIEKNSRLLKFMDEQVSIAVEKRLKEIGVEIILHATVERVSKGEVTIQLRQTSTTRTVIASLVALCTSRKPSFDYRNFEQLGITTNHERSSIIINEETCQTSIPTIYACGGVISSCWSWVPCAMRQGRLVANTICEKKLDEHMENNTFHTANNSAIPFVINVIPAVASVGEVPKLSNDVLVYTFNLQCNRRAIIDHQTWGFVKMWTTCDEPKRFLAVQLVHEAAAEIIEYYSMIISLNIPLREVCLLPFAHPTYTESVKEACEYVLGQSTTYAGTYLN